MFGTYLSAATLPLSDEAVVGFSALWLNAQPSKNEDLCHFSGYCYYTFIFVTAFSVYCDISAKDVLRIICIREITHQYLSALG